MPKGGVLHVHSTSAGRAEWVAQTAIASNCWIYWNGNTNDSTNGTLSWTQVDSNYVQVAQARRGKPNFERHLVSLLTIDARDEIHPAWAAWSACYSRMVGLLTRPSFFNAYMVDAFETFARDNADYVELRTDIPYFVGANVPQGITNCIRQYQIAEQQVRQQYPDFKLAVIISPYRGSGLSDISNRIDAALALRSDPQLRNFVVGFDLVGEEMPSTALVRMVPALWAYLQQRTNECGITLPYMFHGGESDWGDDDNLSDAVLLKSHRIGHGINLYRYPVLQQTVRDQPCPIELCPISNQLLRYTLDMRAHPGAGYLGHGLQGVLASDDPCVFGNEGLSYDFHAAYMAWTLNLASLKKLATNSIAFSAQPAEEKVRRGDRWHQKWMTWINDHQAAALSCLNAQPSKP
jgi:adenosine deaminase CECR1